MAKKSKPEKPQRADYYLNHLEYDGLIYITDGNAPAPVVPSEYRSLPVTWVITDDDLIPSISHGWNGSIMK